jgi:3-methyladenine DNA glycosylase/8-oxoguanine DNA glycosylase
MTAMKMVTMSRRIDTEADIEAGLTALLAADPRLQPVAALAGPVPLRRRPGGFAGLAGIVVAQQLSTASANAIWARLAAAYDPFTPQALIRARTARLAGLGLSAPKIRALKEIAKAIVAGRLDGARETIALADPWRPWRGVAARLLWAYYRAIKQRDPAPLQAAQ